MKPRILTILLALSAGAAINAGSIVSDGDFETVTIGYYTGALGDGWTTTLGAIAIQNIADGFGAVPYTGNQFAYLDENYTSNTLDQTLATVAGQSYLVSYWVADDTANALSVSFGAQTLFNGVAPTNGIGLASDYVNYTYTVTATSTSTDLSFTGQYSAGFGTLLDDVSVTAVSSAVPEPATLRLIALGCIALFTARRGQK